MKERKRTPTLLTHLSGRGLAALDRIEAAGWKHDKSARSVTLYGDGPDSVVDELASLTGRR